MAAPLVRHRRRKDALADRFGNLHGAVAAGVRQQHREFFAAIAGGDVARPADRATNRRTDRRQRLIALGMPVAIVEFLEMIDVDHQQRQRLAIARRPAPRQGQRFIETAPVGELRQAVVPRQCRLALFRRNPAPQFAIEHRHKHDNAGRHRGEDGGDQLDLEPPRRQHVGTRNARNDKQGKSLDTAERKKSRHSVHRPFARKRTGLASLRVPKHRHPTPVGADIRIARNVLHEHRTVVSIQRCKTVRAERYGVQALLEKIKLERAGHDAGKTAIGGSEPPADRYAPRALLQTRLERPADVEAVRARRIALEFKVFAVDEIATARQCAQRIENDRSALIQHDHGAEARRGARAIEHRHLLQARRQRHDLGVVHHLRDRLQGEIVQFDIARDILFNQRGDIFGDLETVVQSAAIEIECDRGKHGELDSQADRRRAPDQHWARLDDGRIIPFELSHYVPGFRHIM